MAKLQFTARAETDLIEIWAHIAGDNPQAADRLLDQLNSKCQLLAGAPRLGQARPDIAPEMRYLPVARYLILYREIDNGIEVVRVVHGKRYLPDLV